MHLLKLLLQPKFILVGVFSTGMLRAILLPVIIYLGVDIRISEIIMIIINATVLYLLAMFWHKRQNDKGSNDRKGV